MKVCTCLNPLHTALAVYGCLLGYTLIADEMKDAQLKGSLNRWATAKGCPSSPTPASSTRGFIAEVLEQRLTNGNLPDTPQRIATDTSQKVGIRFGETIRAYGDKAKDLTYVPLVIAGWCRYLLAVDDEGKSFTPSPDTLLQNVQEALQASSSRRCLGQRQAAPHPVQHGDFRQRPVRSRPRRKDRRLLRRTHRRPHAVRNTLVKYVK